MPHMFPVAGARSEARVRENCTTIDLVGTDMKEIEVILNTFPEVGARYPGAGAELAEY